MLKSEIDHLVISAPTKARGIEYVADLLGVTPTGGGFHPKMGTHNALLRLGEETYLEVIAIDPDARDPERPRWFGLDHLAVDSEPQLITWVCRTSDIETATQNTPFAAGSITEMSRGNLHWLISLPDDGSLIWEGIAPNLIQWSDQPPVISMPVSSCELESLELNHPQAIRLNNWLQEVEFDSPCLTVSDAAPISIKAKIQTPRGLCTL